MNHNIILNIINKCDTSAIYSLALSNTKICRLLPIAVAQNTKFSECRKYGTYIVEIKELKYKVRSDATVGINNEEQLEKTFNYHHALSYLWDFIKREGAHYIEVLEYISNNEMMDIWNYFIKIVILQFMTWLSWMNINSRDVLYVALQNSCLNAGVLGAMQGNQPKLIKSYLEKGSIMWNYSLKYAIKHNCEDLIYYILKNAPSPMSYGYIFLDEIQPYNMKRYSYIKSLTLQKENVIGNESLSYSSIKKYIIQQYRKKIDSK